MQIHGNNIYKQKIHLLIAVKVQDKLQKYVVPFYAVCDGAGCPVDIRLAQTVAFTKSSQKISTQLLTVLIISAIT